MSWAAAAATSSSGGSNFTTILGILLGGGAVTVGAGLWRTGEGRGRDSTRVDNLEKRVDVIETELRRRGGRSSD